MCGADSPGTRRQGKPRERSPLRDKTETRDRRQQQVLEGAAGEHRRRQGRL